MIFMRVLLTDAVIVCQVKAYHRYYGYTEVWIGFTLKWYLPFINIIYAWP